MMKSSNRDRSLMMLPMIANNIRITVNERDLFSKVKSYINCGGDIDDHGFSMADGTMLHRAVEVGNAKLLELLIKKGAHIDATDQRGNTPLHLACSLQGKGFINKNRGDFIRVLLDKGADVNKRGCNGDLPVGMFILSADGYKRGEFTFLLKLMKQHGADFNLVDGRLNPLISSVSFTPSQFSFITETMIECGASVNAVNANGDSALHVAMMIGNHQNADVLLKMGADPNLKNNLGHTPVFIDISQVGTDDESPVTKTLIARGGNPFIMNNEKCIKDTVWEKIIKTCFDSTEWRNVMMGHAITQLAEGAGHIARAESFLEKCGRCACF